MECLKRSKNYLLNNMEERVNILYSRSAYGNDKPHMSKEQNEEFKFPCSYVTYKDGSMKCLFSKTNNNGHFGVSKVIWSNGGASSPVIDEAGEYGLTNFSYAIIDEPENLPFIQKAMLNPKFIELMSFSDGTTGVGRHRYNKKAISLFRKDWWKEYQY